MSKAKLQFEAQTASLEINFTTSKRWHGKFSKFLISSIETNQTSSAIGGT
jgi:hypothetical protein